MERDGNLSSACFGDFCGVIIGLDREYKNKGAGIKTHALVCIGAAMAMIVNEYVFREFPNMNTDITLAFNKYLEGLEVFPILFNCVSEADSKPKSITLILI